MCDLSVHTAQAKGLEFEAYDHDMTPSDARKFNAKYSGRCSECRTAISIGESCLWSPSSKKLGCTKCWGEIEATKPTSTRKASAKVEDPDQKNGNNYALIYERAYSRKLAKQ